MYSIRDHRRAMAAMGANLAGLVAIFLVCFFAAAVVLKVAGPLWAIVVAVAACVGWYIVGIPHTSGPVLTLSRVLVFGLNALVVLAAVLNMLWG